MNTIEIAMEKAFSGWKIHSCLFEGEILIKKVPEKNHKLPEKIHTALREKCMQGEAISMFFDIDSICYAAFYVSDNYFLVLGPCCVHNVLARKEKESVSTKTYISIKQLIAAVSIIYYIATGIYIREEDIEKSIGNIEEDDSADSEQMADQLLNDDFEMYGYEDELKYREEIARGEMYIDVPALIRDFDKIDRVELLSIRSERKRFEYMTVRAIVYAGEACMEAGVPHYKQAKIQETYLHKLTACRNEMEILHVYAEAVNSFSKISREYKDKIKGGYVEQCKNYVGKNIRKKLTVKQIADALNVNENYLSRIFSKTEGIPLKKYILQERIKLSANLLKNTEVNIGMIADYYNFHSQSYFTEVFKEFYGISPMEYRKKYHIKN